MANTLEKLIRRTTLRVKKDPDFAIPFFPKW
jgi:hypothetical protein